MPARMNSARNDSRWNAISLSMSRSRRPQVTSAMTRRTRRRSSMSGSLFDGAKDPRDGRRQALPALELGPRGGASLPRQRVELGLPVVVGHAPCGLDQTLLLEAIQRGVERAFLDLQDVGRQQVN